MPRLQARRDPAGSRDGYAPAWWGDRHHQERALEVCDNCAEYLSEEVMARVPGLGRTRWPGVEVGYALAALV